jgi:undecaprenyl-diphosphatase
MSLPRAAFIVTICGVGLALLASWVWLGDPSAWERAMLLEFRDATQDYAWAGPAWLPEIFRDLTSLAGTGLVALIVLFVLIYLLLRNCWRGAALMTVLMLGTLITNTALKLLFDRPRPDFLTHGAYEHTPSFPSGHSAMAAATALTLAWVAAEHHKPLRLKAFFWIVGLLTLGLIGFSRIYLGVHYPTDVLAGWLVGAAWACITAYIAGRLRHLPCSFVDTVREVKHRLPPLNADATSESSAAPAVSRSI